jgi:hypothetical protein
MDPVQPIPAIELKSVTVYKDANGVEYRKVLASEAAECENIVKGAITTKNKKGETSRSISFYTPV